MPSSGARLQALKSTHGAAKPKTLRLLAPSHYSPSVPRPTLYWNNMVHLCHLRCQFGRECPHDRLAGSFWND